MKTKLLSITVLTLVLGVANMGRQRHEVVILSAGPDYNLTQGTNSYSYYYTGWGIYNAGVSAGAEPVPVPTMTQNGTGATLPLAEKMASLLSEGYEVKSLIQTDQTIQVVLIR
jgi:hypothetical protein